MEMIFSAIQLAHILQISVRATRRLAKTLNFTQTKQSNKLFYSFPEAHPLNQSIILIKSNITKPIYTVSELSLLWEWRKGHYSNERVRQLLNQFNIPIQNKSNKGFIYISDLKNLIN